MHKSVISYDAIILIIDVVSGCYYYHNFETIAIVYATVIDLLYLNLPYPYFCCYPPVI